MKPLNKRSFLLYNFKLIINFDKLYNITINLSDDKELFSTNVQLMNENKLSILTNKKGSN